VDAEVTAAQAAWDALPEEQKTELIKDLLQSHYHKEFTQWRTIVISEVTE
jgi:hypothetical protein